MAANLIPDQYLERVIEIAINAVGIYWRMAGHPLTGKFLQTLEAKKVKFSDRIEIQMLMQVYGPINSAGIKPERVPYRRGSGATRSKLIDGFKRYARLRFGASRKEAERIAHAIATKWKKEGMKGTGWLDKAVKDIDSQVEALLATAIEEIYTSSVEQALKT